MIRLRIEGMAHGGRGVGRAEGMAVFVPGAMPGEQVEVEPLQARPRYLEAQLLRVLEPSPARVEPPCAHFGSCGGCHWQMGAYADQLRWKREIVASQLRHLGGLREVEVRDTLAPGPPYGYRNRMDFQVAEGRPALLAARSQRQVRIEHCHLLAGPLQALFAELGEVRGSRVTLRAGLRTGETVVLVDGSRGVIHEEVAGVRFRITGRAFFQTNTWGADALVRLVREALDPAPGELLLDGYSGGGLFSATVGAGLSVVAVESDRVAVSDLRHNTEYVTVVTSRFEHARPALPPSWDLAVVDPPRRGLNQTGCRVVADGRPRVICYVSCDPATFARDARYLAGMGYRISWVQPVDLFPQTFHVELVACFRREEAGFLSQT